MYLSKDFINGLIYATVLTVFAFATGYAKADTRMGKSTSDAYFKIDGEGKYSAIEADEAAKNHKIQQCKPIKNSEPQAYKCSEVIKEYNAKSGAPHWVRP